MFQAPKLTDAGKNLYYRNMAGEGIKFTTIQLGNGTISGPISAMTALVSAVVTIDAAVKNNAEQYADVSGHFRDDGTHENRLQVRGEVQQRRNGDYRQVFGQRHPRGDRLDLFTHRRPGTVQYHDHDYLRRGRRE